MTRRYLCFLMVLLLLQTCRSQVPEALLLGGNGFIGSETALLLINAGWKVTTINRGNVRWDFAQRVAPLLTEQMFCDRTQSLNSCTQLHKLRNKYFNVILDFSGYESYQVIQAIKEFEGRFDLYLFLSSDSVYEVSALASLKPPGRWPNEDSDLRPDDLNLREMLAQRDPYAENKMACEEAIATMAKELHFSWAAIRSADVFGARDNSNRLWQLFTQIRLHNKRATSLQLPIDATKVLMSFAYAPDLAGLLVQIANRYVTKQSISQQGHTVYNFAYQFQKTLLEIVRDICEFLQIPESNFRWQLSANVTGVYPSVSFGPIVTTRMFKEFNPPTTPWWIALDTTLNFYLKAERRSDFLVHKKAMAHLVAKMEGVSIDEVFSSMDDNSKLEL